MGRISSFICLISGFPDNKIPGKTSEQMMQTSNKQFFFFFLHFQYVENKSEIATRNSGRFMLKLKI